MGERLARREDFILNLPAETTEEILVAANQECSFKTQAPFENPKC
jgi:hypothetical protein